MDNELHISVIDPISPAIERVKDLLFRPFALGQWFVIGFCAFLANLNQGGFWGFLRGSFNVGNVRGAEADVTEMAQQAEEYVNNNLYWILPLTITIIVLSIFVWILFLWLSSRGKFMFLYCIAEKSAEVKRPWKKYRHQGNSLCLFRLVLGIISAFCICLPTAPIVYSGISLWKGDMDVTAGILIIVLFGLASLGILIIFALIGKFTKDFVVPIMYLHGCRTVEGWRIFWPMLKERGGLFTLYILFYILILFSVWMIVNVFGVCTCCCGSCLLSIPYIGTVLILPIFVFMRSYSLYFLSQFGPNWDVFNIPQVVPLSSV